MQRERLLAYHERRPGTAVRAMPRADWKRARLMTRKNTGPNPVAGNQIGPGRGAQLCIIAGADMDLTELAPRRPPSRRDQKQARHSTVNRYNT